MSGNGDDAESTEEASGNAAEREIESKDADIAIIDEESFRFNGQVKNNVDKSDDGFRFQLTKEEADDFRSKN